MFQSRINRILLGVISSLVLLSHPIFAQCEPIQLDLLSGSGSGDEFAWASVFCEDQIIVGAYRHSGDKGAVYVYEQNTSLGWDLVEDLASKIPLGDTLEPTNLFGYSLACEGDFLVIGTPGDVFWSGSRDGVAHVFTKLSGEWEHDQKLTLHDPPIGESFFGGAVEIALIAGEPRIFIGNHKDHEVGAQSGAVYEFRQDGSGIWQQESIIMPGGTNTMGAFDFYGSGLAVDGESGILVVGAPGDDPFSDTSNAGSAYVFKFGISTWGDGEQLLPEQHNLGYTSSEFGHAVAIDDNAIFVGAPVASYKDGGITSTGAVGVYSLDGLGNAQFHRLLIGESKGDRFGYSIALNKGVALIGAPGRFRSAPEDGASYVFRRASDTWRQVAELDSSHRPGVSTGGDRMGTHVSLNGTMAAVGAQELGSQGPGSLFFFGLSPVQLSNCRCSVLEFDGAEDGVSVPFHESFPDTVFSAVAWIQVEGACSYDGAIITRSEDNQSDMAPWALYILSTGELALRIESDFQGDRLYRSGEFLDDGFWHHVATSRGPSGDLAIYIDGDPSASFSSSIQPSSNNAQFLTIGFGLEDGGIPADFFFGSIDEPSVWNRELSPAEIKDLYSGPPLLESPGLVGLWSFDEDVNEQTCFDGSPFSNHGVLGLDDSLHSDDPNRSSAFCLVPPFPARSGRLNRFETRKGDPGGVVYLGWSGLMGATTIFGGNSCGLMKVDLLGATSFGPGISDVDGVQRFDGVVPASASGQTLYFQAFDSGSCSISNPVRVEFL